MDIYKLQPSDFLDESIYVKLMDYGITRQEFSTEIKAAKNLIKALRRFNETLKDAIDPNGIIAPGRGGIWPANMRNRG